MIGEKTANRLIAWGWIAGLILGGLTAVDAALKLGGLNGYNFIDAAIILGLAYGTYRKSRIGAGLAAAYYAVNQIIRFSMTHAAAPSASVIATIAIFGSAYLSGMIGTFALHGRKDVAQARA